MSGQATGTAARTDRTRRVYLHIGVPKSGTSFLQATLGHNAAPLRDQGVLFPTQTHKGLFHAALELTGNHPGWGIPDARVKGSWARLARQASRHRGTTVLSHELFSNVEPHHIGPMLARLKGLEVHVVVTARDLARQLPAEWQEGVKHGRSLTFPTFLRRVLDPARRHRHARKFWTHQDLPDILERWAAHVGPERVHLVTGPPPGAPRDLLWQRFCAVVGLDAGRTELPDTGANTSLGLTAIDALRRVNRELGRLEGRAPAGQRRTVKQSLVNGALRGADGSDRVTLPARVLPQLQRITEDWSRRIESGGYDVVGDLEDLAPRAAGSGAPSHHRVPASASRDVAVHAVAVLTREVAELREELRRAEPRGATPTAADASGQELEGSPTHGASRVADAVRPGRLREAGERAWRVHARRLHRG